MKSINLLSLVSARNDLTPAVFDVYLNNFGIKIKQNELNDLKSLVNQLQTSSQELDIFEEFYVGYCINQINKEFDLLRFGEKSIINIELKRENTGEKIKEQLVKNKYYLSFLAHHQNVCLTASRLSKTHYYILNKYDTHKSVYFSRSSFYVVEL